MNNYKIIKKYIDEFDFNSLLKHGAPDDEFDSYSKELSEELQPSLTIEEIATIIANKFNISFDCNTLIDDYLDIAQKIKTELSCKE